MLPVSTVLRPRHAMFRVLLLRIRVIVSHMAKPVRAREDLLPQKPLGPAFNVAFRYRPTRMPYGISL
jgi:hypothetical protein